MCGIAGIVNLSGPAAIAPSTLRRMADALAHRGPDEDGYLARPGLGLASRRLSIVGLADGRQPIYNEDRAIAVVFNGELFDYPERKTELQARGHVFRTHCDTELLPHLWEEHGEEMLTKLRGQFAFALWDERRRQLTLARDRFGICPLYWTRRQTAEGEVLLFASEIKALLASGLVPARPDVRGLNHAFTFFALPGPVTCFEGVHCLLPGRYLGIRPDAPMPVEERIYWEIDFPDHGDESWRGFRRFGSNANSPVVDEFEAVFQKAVERRLRGRAGGFLPVGWRRFQRCRRAGQRPTPPRGQGRNPDVYHFGTRRAAAQRTHRGGAGCRSRRLGKECRRLRPAAGARDVPGADPCRGRPGARHIVCRAPDAGADGSPARLQGRAHRRRRRRVVSRLSVVQGAASARLAGRCAARAAEPAGTSRYLRLTGAPPVAWDAIRRVEQLVGGPNAWLNIYGLFGASKAHFFSAGMWERLGDHMPYADLGLNTERARRWHPLNRSLYLGARVMLPGLLLASKGDRVAMNSSVETRYPFLDEDVFDFLAGLHPVWKMRGLRDKLILRYLAQRWLPRSIAWRAKAMFRAPTDSFHTTTLPTFVDQLLSPESLRKTEYFDPAAVQHWSTAFKQMRPSSAQRVMIEMGLVGVVATQLWHHTYIDASLCDLPAWSPLPTVGWVESSEPTERRPTRRNLVMSYALTTLWYERQRFLPAVLAVAFSALLIALQCGLLLGLFSITSIPIDESDADVWVGYPKVTSVDLGRPIPEAWQSYIAPLPEVERTEPFMEGFAYWDKPTGGMELCLVIGTRLGPGALGPVHELTSAHRTMLYELGAIVVDEGEFERLGVAKIGDTAEVAGKHVRIVGTVKGLRSLAGPYVFCSIDTARMILHPPSGQVTFILAKCRNKEDAARVVEALKIHGDKLRAIHQGRLLAPEPDALVDQDQGGHRPRIGRGTGAARRCDRHQPDALLGDRRVAQGICRAPGSRHPALADADDGDRAGILGRRFRDCGGAAGDLHARAARHQRRSQGAPALVAARRRHRRHDGHGGSLRRGRIAKLATRRARDTAALIFGHPTKRLTGKKFPFT